MNVLPAKRTPEASWLGTTCERPRYRFRYMRRPIRGVLRMVRGATPEARYPTPVSALGPERLYAYFDAILQRREIDGAIVEGRDVAGDE